MREPTTLRDWCDYAAETRRKAELIVTVHVSTVAVQAPGLTPEQARRVVRGEDRV